MAVLLREHLNLFQLLGLQWTLGLSSGEPQNQQDLQTQLDWWSPVDILHPPTSSPTHPLIDPPIEEKTF